MKRELLPTGNKAFPVVTDSFLTRLPPGPDGYLIAIRFDDSDVRVRDLVAFLNLVDGAYARSFPKGIYSYAHRPTAQLSIERIQPGSAILQFPFEQLGDIEIWRMILLYLVVRTGPSILKGEAAKNWAEAGKAAGEALNVWTGIANSWPQVREQWRLSRRQKTFIRGVIRTDPLFEDLADRQRDLLTEAVAEILVQEEHNLRGAARFSARHVLEVAVKARRKSADSMERPRRPPR